MMTGVAIRREKNPSDDLGDVLDQLTAAHSSMVERFGEIVGENVPPPDDPLSYAATMAQRAATVDAAPDADSKHLALLRYEWRRHEQIGRLAVYLADYEAAHGDPGNVEAMRELGADHLDLAAGLRETASDEDARQREARNDNAKQEGKTVDAPEDNDREVAEYLVPVREKLVGLITQVAPEDVEKIVLVAAQEAVRRSREERAQAGAQRQEMTIEGLSAEAYSEERRAEIFLPIPPDPSPALMTALRSAAIEELDGMTNRDADPFWPEELERVAAMTARCVDADKALAQANTRQKGKTVAEKEEPHADTVWTPDRDDDPRSQFQDARFIVGDNFDPKAPLPADVDLRFLGAARFMIEFYESEIDEDIAISEGELRSDACATGADWDRRNDWVDSVEGDRIIYWQRMAEIDARLAGESWPPQSREEMLAAFAAIDANQESTTRQKYAIVEQFAAAYEPTWIYAGRFNFGNLSKMRELAFDLGRTANDEGALPDTDLTAEPDIFDSAISEETRGKAAADWEATGLDGKTGGKDGNEL